LAAILAWLGSVSQIDSTRPNPVDRVGCPRPPYGQAEVACL